MMILESGQVCPYANKCQFSLTTIGEPCRGVLPSRKTKFTCTFVVDGEIVPGNESRIPGDQTGRMKVIME